MKRKLIFSFVIIGVFILALIGLIKVSTKKKGREKDTFIELKSEADRYLKEMNLLKAKKLYREILQKTSNPERLAEVKKKLEEVNMKLLLSPVLDECSFEYTVKSGDSLIKIAERFNTTVGLIKRANNLTSNIIRPEQKLKINKCKFSLVIDKSQNLLFLKRKGEVIKTYVVATGKNNSTPVGRFKIINKLKNPTWFKTGAVIPPGSPKNVLGTRWMGLSIKGYGIHGSRDVNDIGKQVTEGCIRMKNEEIEVLYDIVPTGTEVIIVN